jgi:hypothetical protein
LTYDGVRSALSLFGLLDPSFSARFSSHLEWINADEQGREGKRSLTARLMINILIRVIARAPTMVKIERELRDTDAAVHSSLKSRLFSPSFLDLDLMYRLSATDESLTMHVDDLFPSSIS